MVKTIEEAKNIEEALPFLPEETQKRVRTAMAKYDNKWWMSNDPYERAHYQLNEPCLILGIVQFEDDVMKLIGRDFQRPAELVSPALIAEANLRWKEYQEKGVLSDLPKEVAKEKEAAGMEWLTNELISRHKKVIKVNMS